MNLQDNQGKVGIKGWLVCFKNSKLMIISFLFYFLNLKGAGL